MTEVKVRLSKDGPFEVNEKLAGLVPMAGEAEQAVLTSDIDENEQREPIVLWRGKVVDGRCRMKALTLLGKHILYRELDNGLTEEEVKVYVKSVNTRRNLTSTQKVMAACRESLDSTENRAIQTIAKSWGIGKEILTNARYIAKNKPEYIDKLFNGGSVLIRDMNGEEKYTNKITTIYSYIKRVEEGVVESCEHAWKEDTYIKTQAGKEWYYSQIKDINEVKTKMLIAELANYKFNKGK